ncbi:MAG: hypothetical protein HUK20_14885 [Fibrobacter sp.]|nr:hypothetical protein [Fibrobacter sp.]
MRFTRLSVLILGLVVLAIFASCSRESSVKENVNLKNNHSRVFALKEPFKDPQAFVDSIANTPADPNDSIPDTLTVTINDTIYLMGILPYHVEKIYRFQWNLKKSNGKDSIIVTENATPQKWAFAKEGVYYPLFVAVDGNGATDTAGTGTKKTYIRVVDSKPELVVPKDTLWTSNKGKVTFPILASDSFGTIERILVDLNADDKDAKEWKYETRENSDSLYLTIENDPKLIDKKGDQTIKVIAEDDDGNQTAKTVHLHFNRLPKLKIIYPTDGTRHSITERFYFYYECEDEDNPQSLLYYISAKIPDSGHPNEPPQSAFTSDDLIVSDYGSNIYEPINAKGKNVITLLKDPSVEFTGRIYWDMYVSDGYDIVRMERISTGENTSRPWTFFIGDLSAPEGSFYGVAKYQGRDSHEDIRVEFTNGNRIFEGVTDSNGNYNVKIDEGTYTGTIKPAVTEYQAVELKDLKADIGLVITLDDVELKDTAKPSLSIKNFDTLAIRKVPQKALVKDYGSYVDTLTISKDKATFKNYSCVRSEGKAILNCSVNIDNLIDGAHDFVYTAKDVAGNEMVVKQQLVVKATGISMDVNGAQKLIVGKDEDLKFNVEIKNPYPDPDTVLWEWEIEKGKKNSVKTVVTKQSVKIGEETTYKYLANQVIPVKDLSSAETGKEYVMTAKYQNHGANLTAQVKFGVMGNDPIVYFKEPGSDVTVTLNDTVDFKVSAVKGLLSTKLDAKWNCGGKLTSGILCPAVADLDGDYDFKLAFAEVGTQKIAVTVTDNNGKVSSDTAVVVVVSDKPMIKASIGTDKTEYKINTKLDVTVDASDKKGTVNKLEWGCSNGLVAFDNSKNLTPQQTVEEIIQITLPGEETNKYACVFKAIDDDGEFSTDTLKFSTLKDAPTIRLDRKSDVLTIRDEVNIKAIANDQLGYIAKYELSCGSKGNMSNWTQFDGPAVQHVMPSTPVDAYYCAVQVTDDDGNTASDTAVYKVIQGMPSIVAKSVSYEIVTINDNIELNAIARDTLNGRITLYEWGCAPKGEEINFDSRSSTTGRTARTVPDQAYEQYVCKVRISDDDNNVVMDSLTIRIIKGEPSVTIPDEIRNMTLRKGLKINLNATAKDNNIYGGNVLNSDPGSIVKKEWSCAESMSELNNNWVTVDNFEYLWESQGDYIGEFLCMARATDNDGNIATALATITFYDTEHSPEPGKEPRIWVEEENIAVAQGDAFRLNAMVNEENWRGGVSWFSWNCEDSATHQTLEKKDSRYDYEASGRSMNFVKGGEYSQKGVNMLCVVAAQERETEDVLRDTVLVRVLGEGSKPQAKISVPVDTFLIWSGDETLEDSKKYYYMDGFTGSTSTPGALADLSRQEFSWKFSNIGSNFYKGDNSGDLDTSVAEFNNAFIRMSREGSLNITLRYRDSVPDSGVTPSQEFLNRHESVVTKSIYFMKGWQPISPDTTIGSSDMNLPPVMLRVNGKLVIAYLVSSNRIEVRTQGADNTWSTITQNMTDSVTAIRLATDGTNLYMGVLETSNQFSIYKSNSATSTFASEGSISGSDDSPISSPRLLYNPAKNALVVIYLKKPLNSQNFQLYRATKGASSWQETKIVNTQLRECNAVFMGDNRLAIFVVDTNFKLKYVILTSDYTSTSGGRPSSQISLDSTSVKAGNMNLAVDGSTVYMAYTNQDIENDKTGLYIRKVTASGATFTEYFNEPMDENYMTYHMDMVARNGNLYIAFDDAGRPDLSQVNVFTYENDNKWHALGENQLPYFGAAFYAVNKYYYRGYGPMLDIDDHGDVYVSMLGRATGNEHNNKNGPIIMKYVGYQWE